MPSIVCFMECSARSASAGRNGSSSKGVRVSHAGGASHIVSKFFFSEPDEDSSDEDGSAAAVHPSGTDAQNDDQDWNNFGGRVTIHADWQMISLILPSPNSCLPAFLIRRGKSELKIHGQRPIPQQGARQLVPA